MPRKHRCYNAGHLVAMVENDELLTSAIRTQIEYCSECLSNYTHIKTNLQSLSRKQLIEFAKTLPASNCTVSGTGHDGESSILLSFLRDDLPEETATQLFSHLIRCYACFEDFMSNWDGYLSLKN